MACAGRPRGLRAWGLAAALAVGAFVPVAGALAPPALATTKCAEQPGDFGTEYWSAAWPGFTGVPVYSNDDARYKYGTYVAPNSCYNYVTTPSGKSVESGLEWQCVELVNRLYITKGWITTNWSGNGNALYKNASTIGLTSWKQPQGSITYLAPGDVISFDSGKYGHAAVVSDVKGSAITLVNQNTQRSQTISNGTFANGKFTLNTWKGFTAIGVIHAPVRQSLPAEPTKGRDTSATTTSAVLTWTNPANNAATIVSHYRIANGAWVNGPSVNASQTSMTVRGLKPGKRYTFQLGAKNGAGTHWSAYFYVSTAHQPTGGE
jgi:surface antigen